MIEQPGGWGGKVTAAMGAPVSDLRLIRSDTSLLGDDRLGRIVEALAYAVEIKDAHTGQHMYRSALLASSCLEQIDYDLSLDEGVQFGFMLHDVGKIGVPDHILRKKGPLTAEEWDVMRAHPEMGLRIVEPMGFSPKTVDVILYHHERWDGGGYPFGLRGAEIPLAARVFAVVDAYDALTCERPYRSAIAKSAALSFIESEAGGRFDPRACEALFALIS